MAGLTYRTEADLFEAGLVSADALPSLREVGRQYAIALPEGLAQLINPSDPSDPIRAQYVPSSDELIAGPGASADPIGDKAHSPVPGIVHRYPDRALLKVTAVCPVYCRFCFRREMIGPEKGESLSRVALDGALSYIAAHPEIFEVILTGGDPMILSPGRARLLTQALENIGHVGIIRWHTRVPVVAPERVSDAFVEAIRSDCKSVFVAVHANHAREFTPAAVAAIRRLARAGIALVSQSVLLKGVNDDYEALSGLMRAFLSAGVKPYYLHQLDAAPGTGHFRVPVEEGRRLVQRLRDELTGLATPLYVADIPGGVSKAVLNVPDIERREDRFMLRGRDGTSFPMAE